MISEMNARSREILRYIIDAYLETGEPVGSRAISRKLGLDLSPATIRNVMADLEDAGLLYAPHRSAGRLPTESGLRFFVDGLLEIRDLGAEERALIESRFQKERISGASIKDLLGEAGAVLSGLSSCAGLVMAPKRDKRLKQIEFVRLSPERLLVILVDQDGMVENRVMEAPPEIPAESLTAAANYLNDRLAGRSLEDARTLIQEEIQAKRAQLDEISAKVVEQGLALRPSMDPGFLIVRGQSNLLGDVRAVEDLENIRELFEALDTHENLLNLIDKTRGAQGVQIYIGAENEMFRHSGWSMILAPYTGAEDQIVGAIGVIGPNRLNYARIIPIVDYTSKVIAKALARQT